MTMLDRYCERCGRVTAHSVGSFEISRALPTADQKTDLTGRDLTSQAPQIKDSLPSTVRYACSVCGYVSVIMGPDQQKKGEDLFSKLERGEE